MTMATMFQGWRIKAKIFAQLNLIGVIALIQPATTLALPLSPGDRLEVSIPNEKYFARTYQVNHNGDIEVPFLGAVSVVGLEPIAVETKLSQLLIAQYLRQKKTRESTPCQEVLSRRE